MSKINDIFLEIDADDLGLVIYTDGGARPNPGHAGSGIHGYVYNYNDIKPESKKKMDIPTKRGYVSHDDIVDYDEHPDEYGKPEVVEPVMYLDGIISYGAETTNNYAELNAVLAVLNELPLDKVRHIHILTDSLQYVVKGILEYIPKWKVNSWTTSSGKSIQNPELWRSTSKALDKFNGSFIVEYIQGHAGHLGNELADKLATEGVMVSRKVASKLLDYESIGYEKMAESGSIDAFMRLKTSPAKKYWSNTLKVPPLFKHSKLYYMVNDAGSGDKYHGDRRVYYFGRHGSDDTTPGRRTSDHSHAVVLTKTPDPILESVMEYHDNIINNDYGTPAWLNLDIMFTSKYYTKLTNDGTIYLNKSPKSDDLVDAHDNDIAITANPPGLSFRALEALNSLESVLVDYDNGDIKTSNGHVIHDITNVIYDDISLGSKTKCIVKQTDRSINIDLDIHGNQTALIILTLGQDIPSRNTLAAIAGESPKISLLAIEITKGKVYTIYTIIETDDTIMIMTTPYSNSRLINPKRGK